MSTHQIVALASSMRHAVAGVAGVDPLYMTTGEKASALGDLRRLVSSVSELYLRVLASADDLALETGARDPAAWLAATQLADPRAARADLGLAESLLKYPRLAAAMAAGEMSLEQARVIVRTLTALPEDLAAAEEELRESADADADADPGTTPAPIDVQSVMDRAEAELVRLAGEFRPSELTRLGRHLLEVVAPEVADAADEAALKREEQNAAEKTSMSLRSNGDGSTRITGTVSGQIAARLRAYLEAFAQPRVAALDADGERMPTHRLYGLAFGDLMERIDPTTLPDHGGDATTVMVLLDYEYLLRETGRHAATTAAWATHSARHPQEARAHGPGPSAAAADGEAAATDADAGAGAGAGAGARATGSRAGTMTTTHARRAPGPGAADPTTDAGEAAARAAAATLGDIRVSAGEARRLACQARIVPVVLDGQSQPLDLGRAKRLFSPAQRKAVRVRDGGCRAEGCTAPPAWCDVHHLHAWADGGPTDLANGISLCAHHHHKIHDTAYRHEHTPAGRVKFHARQ